MSQVFLLSTCFELVSFSEAGLPVWAGIFLSAPSKCWDCSCVPPHPGLYEGAAGENSLSAD